MEMFRIENVALDLPATSKDDVLISVADAAVRLGYATDADDVLAGMREREEQVSTALMDGIAIPHAKRESITSAALLVQRFTTRVDWSGEPVNIALAMLVPDAEAGTTHLQLLAQISRALIEDDVRRGLATSSSAQEIYDLLAARLHL